MPDADAIDTALQSAALAPKEVAADGQSVKAHSLKEQIEAAKYLRGQEAQAGGKLGVKFLRINSGGARPL